MIGSFTFFSQTAPKKRKESQMSNDKSVRTATAAKANNGKQPLKGGLSGSSPANSLLAAAAAPVKVALPPKLERPPIDRKMDVSAIELLDLEFRQVEEKDEQIAPSVGEWMESTALPDLDKIRGMVARLGDKFLELSAGKDENGQPMTFRQQQKMYEDLIFGYLNAALQVGENMEGNKPMLVPCPKIRAAAHLALLKHRFSVEMDRDQFLAQVELSIADGYFVRDDDGYIHVWQRRYALSDDEKFGKLGEAQERMLAEIIGQHVGRLNKAFAGRTQIRIEEFAGQSKISPKELLEVQEGSTLVHVPQDPDNRRNGEVYLFLNGDGEGKVYLLDAVGPDQNRALKIRDNKIFLQLGHLGIVKGNPGAKAFPNPPRIETMTEGWGFSVEDAELYRLFWFYVDRARNALQAQARRDAERKRREQAEAEAAQAERAEQEKWQKAKEEAPGLEADYRKECTVSLDWVMDGKEGRFFGKFAGEWKNRLGNVPDGLLFFQGEQRIVEKIVDGEARKVIEVRVKKAPSWLTGTFFSKEAFEFTAYGAMFEGLPQPFRGLMKALHRQSEKTATA